MPTAPTPEERLRDLALELPAPAAAAGSYVGAVRAGDLLFLSGHGPVGPDGRPAFRGVVGRDVSLEQAQEAARLTALALLGTARAELGSLDRIERAVKLLVLVNAVPGFDRHPLVANGASDLLLAVLGPERGAHARSAVGMGSLPFGIPVEIEAVLAVS